MHRYETDIVLLLVHFLAQENDQIKKEDLFHLHHRKKQDLADHRFAIIFQVVPLTIRQWSIVFLLAMTPIFVVELQKKINRKKRT